MAVASFLNFQSSNVVHARTLKELNFLQTSTVVSHQWEEFWVLGFWFMSWFPCIWSASCDLISTSNQITQCVSDNVGIFKRLIKCKVGHIGLCFLFFFFQFILQYFKLKLSVILVFLCYRKREEDAKKTLLQNPVKMRQLQKLVRLLIFRIPNNVDSIWRLLTML